MLEYLHRCDMESTYTTPSGISEPLKSHNRRLFTLHLTSRHAAADSPEIRVEKLRPNIDWVQTWKNLNEEPVPETTRSVRYRVIHEIISTNDHLHRINIVQTDTCQQCAAKDTLEHRLLVFGEGRVMWEY